jgi:di/tricarboxylate transporter
MTLDTFLLLAVLLFMMTAFVREWLPLDVVALSTLALLLLFDLVDSKEAVSGFSNEAVMTVMMMFIISDALVRSGVVARIAHAFANISETSHWPGSIALMIVAGVLSAFINNVAALTIFMPVSLHLAKHYKVSPTKLLLPLSYATIFGGACTLVGTSTNLLVSSLAEEYGFTAFTMFEFLAPGSILFAIGLLYTIAVPMRLLPSRITDDPSLTQKYHLSSYLTELRIAEGSSIIGRTVVEEGLNERFSLNVLEILRGKRKIATDIRNTRLEAGDTLILRGTVEDILSFKDRYRLLLLTDLKLDDGDLSDKENILMDVQLSPISRLVGQTIREIDFRKTYGCFVLALNRHGDVIREKLVSIPLERWDTLLVFGPRPRIEALGEDFIQLDEHELRLGLRRNWWIAASVVPVVMILAAFSIMPILKAAILGAVTLIVSRAITIQQAYQAINWTVIFLVAAVLPLGKAMMNTGLATQLGDLFALFGTQFGAFAVIALLYFTTTFLTEVMSNNSTAVLMIPIAITTAASMGYDNKTFLMTVTFAASASFLTPMGYKTNAMVYGPGGYRFMDYIRMGFPLKIAVWIISVFLVPMFWPLQNS